jgi:hypothetical protein
VQWLWGALFVIVAISLATTLDVLWPAPDVDPSVPWQAEAP